MTVTNEQSEATFWETEADLNKAEAEFYKREYHDLLPLSNQIKKERIFYFISIASLLIIQIIVCLE